MTKESDPFDKLPGGLKLFLRNLHSLVPTKLEDKNFPSWSSTVKATPTAHRLLGYVDGTEGAPPTTVPDEKATIDKGPVMKSNPAYDQWVVIDAQLRYSLLTLLSLAVQNLVYHCTTTVTLTLGIIYIRGIIHYPGLIYFNSRKNFIIYKKDNLASKNILMKCCKLSILLPLLVNLSQNKILYSISCVVSRLNMPLLNKIFGRTLLRSLLTLSLLGYYLKNSILSLNKNFILVHPQVLQRRFTQHFMPPMEAIFRHIGVAVDGPAVVEEQAATATAVDFSLAVLEAEGEGRPVTI
ncbi:unnamed protein product [Cuscuta campestris]|uniref:Retrotransposon Copia-like N-terminal domain-containing protein n=1 Tax=Cuscuta campestris TaxID=132261 RepID=A0A484MMJ8_9ASTE|nr:unnamed protein product [Cuscuta campestris]